MKRTWKKALTYILVLVMCFSATNVPTYAQENTKIIDGILTEKVTVSDNNSNDTNDRIEHVTSNEITTTERTYMYDTYNDVFTLLSSWECGYNANIKIQNTGANTIQNWYISFEYPNDIFNIWNAEISKYEAGRYTIKNAGWNQDIKPNEAIEFGISGNQSFCEFPEQLIMLGTNKEVYENDYSILYTVDSDWESGFTGNIQITNNTDHIIEDWIIEFDFDREITDVWNAVIESHEGNHYVIRNAGHNANINSKQIVSFGFKGTNGSIDSAPQNAILHSYEPTIEIDLSKDSDNDGVEDYIEQFFGTAYMKSDTDDDGINDFIELYSLILDPFKPDTDNNGINDSDEDLDKDGLSNITELQIGTSILHEDTDIDGLSDYDETQLYKTNPLMLDTDGDYVSDSKELTIGTDPLVYQEIFELCINAKNEDSVKASVEMSLSGNQVESLSIEKYNNELFFPSEMPGHIGCAYDFSVDGEFEAATIKFEFDRLLLLDASFDPVIYYFNEDKQLLEELETTVTDNIASAQVTHFSKYILLNRKVYQNAFEWQDEWSTTGYTGVEVVLVVDDSVSMTSNDRSNTRLTVAQNLIDKLPANSKVGIVRFTESTYKLTSTVIEDFDLAKSYLTTSYFKSSGGTNMYSAINSAFSMYESTDDSVMKMMVVLSDGSTADTNKHSSVVSTANNNNIKIYTAGLGSSNSSYFINYLKPLSNSTGGAFYLASNAGELEDIYNDINKKIDIETDSDTDGIADYYEENMVMFNGVTIKLDKNNPDSDYDGILDGNEVVELNYQYNSDKTKVIVTGKLITNPLEIDTDNDGISDEEETIIGTIPTDDDTDNDGLKDGYEYTYGYDPLAEDIDGDGRLDYQEDKEGTDPYLYNKDWYEHTWDFICGFIAGDFIADTDSLPTIMGQLTSSYIPLVDIRDVVGNCVNGDYVFAGMSFIGLTPAIGDGVKTAGKIGKFVVKNVEDIPKIAGLLEFLTKNFPDAIKVLNKSDDFVDAAKQLSKLDNIKLTRKQAKIITDAFEEAGLSHYLVKTSNSLDIKNTLNKGSNVWEQSAIDRGKDIDEFFNEHSIGNGLGKNFPVADRLIKNEKILVSTKSLDIAAQSYQNPQRLKRVLNTYADSLKNIEKNYFDADALVWGGTTLKTSQYNKKALEIVLPDVIISEDALKVLTEFKATMEKEGIGVWYCIVN